MQKIQSAALLACAIAVLSEIVGINLAAADESPVSQNRLAQENSPYLLLHAHNPVNWYPWGAEALEKARAEEKPIFLSVGYSSCYWCHVMERKVFSNPKIAEYLNENFVCVKVDREERPDLDDVYMTSLLVYQQLSGGRGRGGWPLSLFLTPEGDPIAGATYLPPDDQPDGRTGFLTAARRITKAWDERREDVVRTSQLISQEVRRLSLPAAVPETNSIDSKVVQTAVTAVTALYDSEWGGVDLSEANQQGPRFPNIPRLLLLMSVIEQSQTAGAQLEAETDQLLNIVRHSLSQIAQGGIHDHLAGGFHRYSTDRRWRVPHFEKMLYDQAQLLESYAIAGRLTGEPLFEEVAAGIADFVRNEFTTADGAFCSALDAETNAIEGEYYVWQEADLDQLLSADDAALFKAVYGVNRSNTFEHGHVLYLPISLDEFRRKQKMPMDQLVSQLSTIRQTLLDVRKKRERPLLDDKILTSWNAMMIRSLAISGQQFGRISDIAAAEKAARFVLQNLRSEDGSLLRSWRNGEAAHAAYLDDYAYLVSALIALYDATGSDAWMQAARELNQQQISRFYDAQQHVFYFTAHDHEKLIARTSSPFDSVFPSGNSMAIRNMIRLAGRSPDLSAKAEQTLLKFLPMMEKSPAASCGLALAVHEWLLTAQKVASVTQPATQTVFRPASGPRSIQRDKAEKRVRVKVYPYFDKLPRGEKCPIAIELTVQDGWHINANPSNPGFLIPTKVTLKTSPEVKIKLTKIKYPKYKLHEMQQEPEPYHVYDGKVMVYCLLEIDSMAQGDGADLEFSVRYQACNDEQCEKPVIVVMKGKMSLADPGENIKKTYQNKFPQSGKPRAGTRP